MPNAASAADSKRELVIRRSKKVRKVFALVGNACGIGLILLSLFVSNQKTPIWNREANVFVAVISACFCSLFITWLVTGRVKSLSDPERVAISIECCFQNVGIASSMAFGIYGGDDLVKAIALPMIYGTSECVLLGIFCVISYAMGWTYANPSEVGPCQAIIGLHQGEDKATKEGKGKSGGLCVCRAGEQEMTDYSVLTALPEGSP